MVVGAREQIFPRRMAGQLVKWHGRSGVIEPSEQIDHPAAALKEGKVLLAQEDIDGLSLEPGCQVSFYVYADRNGLGALRCRPALGSYYTKVAFGDTRPVKPIGPASAQRKATAGKGSSAHKNNHSFPNAKNGSGGAGQKGGAARFGGHWGMMSGGNAGGLGMSYGRSGAAYGGIVDSAYGGNSKVGSSGGWEDQSAASYGGPNLARTRLSAEPFSGHVVEWKGKMGWIQPDEEIEHPKANEHKGHLYLHQKDVLEGMALEVGKQVCFHIYEDESGLGAEECFLL